jgi:mono/diheme cytochrome c family protein
MSKRILFSALLGVALMLVGLSAITQPVSAQRSKDRLALGRQLYYQYCASCHGEDGKGNGPAASALKAAVPNLHQIAKVDGKFPALRVKNIIAGEVDVPAHGNKAMPVWGQFFREKRDRTTATLNIHALTVYLEAIQDK